MSQASIDFVVDGYRRYNDRDRSQPWPSDHELAIWHEDAEYVASREDPDSIEMEMAHVYILRDGNVAQILEYFDRAEAFELIGLSK